jgi:hypothetical protein
MCSHTLGGTADDFKPRGGKPGATYNRPQSRACGGIGRRARLRALWGVSPVGVRVSLGALEKPRGCGVFSYLRVALQAAELVA